MGHLGKPDVRMGWLRHKGGDGMVWSRCEGFVGDGGMFTGSMLCGEGSVRVHRLRETLVVDDESESLIKQKTRSLEKLEAIRED